MLISKLRICLIVTATFTGLMHVQASAKEKAIHTTSDEEAFLIRRIAEFWKDGDVGIVKTQIVDFLDHYPSSSLSSYFLGILGDIYLQESHYEEALSTYQQIQDREVEEKILMNKLQCYYQLDQYKALAEDGRPYLSSEAPEIAERKEELHFLMGEALFRQALNQEDSKARQLIAEEAQAYYTKLPKGEYSEVAEFALAEIAAMLHDYEKAATAYVDLANKHPEMEEELLFQVGSLRAKYNPLGAIETFRKVKDLKGSRSQEAAFNLMVLLFQTEDYEEILSSYEALMPEVSEEFRPTFDFIVGKSFFCVGKHEQAVHPLKKYIQSTYIPSDQLKNALLVQMTCAHQTGDEALFSESFEKLDSLFPNDSEIPKALFMHAMLLKEQGAISEADAKLTMIKENYPSFEGEESFVFEYGLFAHQSDRWEESYATFKGYTSFFEETPRIDAAWKLFLSSAINLYKEGGENNPYAKPQFFADLKNVLDHCSALTPQEMQSYALLYSKIAYELDQYTDAIRCLQDYIFTSLEEENIEVLAEAHFIAGLCHVELGGDYSAFCMHLEKAIFLDPDIYDSASTHLQLYNAYISLAGYGDTGELPSDGQQQKEFADHAAEHLQEAISRGNTEIKDENRLWLANHFYQKLENLTKNDLQNHPDLSVAIERASTHYQELLLKNERLLELNVNNLHLENEVIRLAKLFELQDAQSEKLHVLKSLLQQQSEKPELNWSSQKLALYELAGAYDALGEKEKAFETYSFIHAQAGHFPSALASSASLEASRLHFELLETEMKEEQSAEVLAILNDLKELQIRKNAYSEPTHLEAALEYAKIRSVLSAPEEQDERYLFFLTRMQEDFTSQEDLVTQDYLLNLNRDSSKKEIFDVYMKFIEAEKLRLKAKNYYKQEQLGEMEELHENALAIYSEIKNNRNTPRDLYGRILSSIHAINALNAY